MEVEEFLSALKQHGIVLTGKQQQQFADYATFLQAENQRMNLTTVDETQEIYLKHFFDSLTLAFYEDFSLADLTLCDVGSGAGFPGIPLKIVYPQLKLTIVDSLNKRVRFLESLTQHLGLTGVHCIHARAETFGQDPAHREQFMLVTARAVAQLSVLSELCLPLVTIGGRFIAMKANRAKAELQTAHRALQLLGGSFERDIAFHLPEAAGERYLLQIKKIKSTPKQYPRKPGTPNKKPL